MVMRNAICRLRPMANNAVIQRNFTFGPPRVRMSMMEKVGYYSIAMVIIAGPNLWITTHMREYMGKA